MRHVDIVDKIPELVEEHPAWDVFVRLGNLTKLHRDPSGSYFHANYESGLLLYALVKHFRPESVLEIGTGRGYGCLSMAMALDHMGSSGKVVTLDVNGYSTPQEWAIDDGSGPCVRQLSLKDVWEAHVGAAVRERVEYRQGSSVASLRYLLESLSFEPDLVYIDADHSFAAVQHDFLAAMMLARRPFRILLDDYTPRSHRFGVRRFVDTQLEPAFDLEAIHTDRRWPGEDRCGSTLASSDYAQILVDSERVAHPAAVERLFGSASRRVERHRRWGWLGPRALRRRIRRVARQITQA